VTLIPFASNRSSWPGIAVRRTASLPLAYDPAIHHLRENLFFKRMDARVKPVHDCAVAIA